MFVSSYSTYISTNNSQKLAKERVSPKVSNESFESKLTQSSSVLESKTTQNLPISYISNYKAFNNKQKLQEEFEDKSKTKYTEMNTLKNAEIAYEKNSKIFSLFLEPKITLNQAPTLNKKLPSDMQQLQEKNMRHKMVNTYLDNDKYYQITA